MKEENINIMCVAQSFICSRKKQNMNTMSSSSSMKVKRVMIVGRLARRQAFKVERENNPLGSGCYKNIFCTGY
jgi:hypothetical protein